MHSGDLGKLFERAASKILCEMFKCWGYDIISCRSQKSGSQHGFDIFFKITDKHNWINIFVECKTSEKYNTIRSTELTEKISQLDWADFPEKDVLVFLSPSRAVDFENERLTLEDDTYSFVIVDWMRKPDRPNMAMELFWAYQHSGHDAEILEYCDFLFTHVDTSFQTGRGFAEICSDLKHRFNCRIAEHSAKTAHHGFSISNGAFWTQARQETDHEFIHYYYTKVDSTPTRLRDVVASNLHVANEALDKEFDSTLKIALEQKTALIKILSKGGEGKSTFLYHTAKRLHDLYFVIWVEDPSVDTLTQIERSVRLSAPGRPLLLLLDNAAIYLK
jgi:hypothetical protein